MVVFDYGLLLFVICVSMVMLGLFVLVEINGCVFVDGGFVSNLFVDIVW